MPQTRLPTDIYLNPLCERYAGREMLSLFSNDYKFTTWRKLWIALAECEMELGCDIAVGQIDEMKAHLRDIDYDAVARYESKTRHDVMAHIHAYGDLCPSARPIIHLGATSAFVGDNTDLIQIREACVMLLGRLDAVIRALRNFALEYRDLATLGFTHFQPAQPTTVGKRACLWLLDLQMDFEALEQFVRWVPFLGVKGTTGTQASFLALFNGDHAKVKNLDEMVSARMGFRRILPVAGQTYTRKIDAMALSLLSGLAQSFHKMANDIRLLQSLKEIEEPFEKGQVGSSAMAYKRNPMRSERLTSLARFIMTLAQSPAMTAAEQWFERTLDDSANKRMSIPEAFLSADASCIIAGNICEGLVVYPRVIESRIRAELPFMATENILMAAVKRGGDRQTLHERIRGHSMEAAKKVKLEGAANDLLDRIAGDPAFGMSRAELDRVLNIRDFVGRAPEQTAEFIEQHIDPLLARAEEYGKIAMPDLRV